MDAKYSIVQIFRKISEELSRLPKHKESDSNEFHIGDALSVTTGKLVSPEHIGGVYKILNYMTSDDLFTHAVPRAIDVCKPFLIVAYPCLALFSGHTFKKSEWALLANHLKSVRLMVPVFKLPENAYLKKDPVQELRDIMDK